MKAIWLSFALLMATSGMAAMAQSPDLDPAGDWRGTLTAGAIKLRVAMHLGETSTFDSLDQGAVGLPARLKVTGNRVSMDIEGVGIFEGALSPDGSVLEGVLRQGPTATPLRFERGSFPALKRPQTPLPPFPYRAEQISYRNPRQADVLLAGTLTLPENGGPFPAVLLITGSGAQDRDETVFGHKPFLVLADALTRRGIAVLRVDDRGMGGSSSGPRGATSADYATDVEAGLAWLRTRKDIDPRRIGLVGHSEGAIIASIVASQDPGLGFMVLWAGPGVSGRDILVEQVRAITVSNGSSEDTAQQSASLQGEILDAVIANPDRDALRSSLDAIMGGRGAPLVDQKTITQLTSPWYRYFLSFDPASVLRNLKMPVLALLGGKDSQVTADQNAPVLRAALSKNANAKVEVLPDLNHFLQTAQTGAPEEYGRIEETIAPVALARMVDWITNQSRQR